LTYTSLTRARLLALLKTVAEAVAEALPYTLKISIWIEEIKVKGFYIEKELLLKLMFLVFQGQQSLSRISVFLSYGS
jgi:hypothetical protein